MNQKSNHPAQPDSTMSAKMSPHKQLKNNVKPSEVVCAQGLELLKKNSDDSAVCVKASTATKLVERGWGSFF